MNKGEIEVARVDRVDMKQMKSPETEIPRA